MTPNNREAWTEEEENRIRQIVNQLAKHVTPASNMVCLWVILHAAYLSTKTPRPKPPIAAGCFMKSTYQLPGALQGDFMQTDVLHGCPDNRETTRLRRKHIDLICPLSHVTKEALNRIGGLNVAVHRLRKGIKRQKVLFILGQASHSFWIAYSIRGCESGQVDQHILLCRLLPDANQFGLDITTLSSGDGGQHIALLMRPASVGEGWRQTVPRPRQVILRARQSRTRSICVAPRVRR